MTGSAAFLSPLTPRCPERLMAQARGCAPPRVALVNAGADLPLQGLREAAALGLAEPLLIGDRDRIAAAAARIGWDIAPFRLIHAPRESAAEEAARLVRAGEADALMKGQIHTSAFLKALLPARAGLRAPDTRCAHVFHVTVPGSDDPLLLTDAALNVAPDVATRKAALTHAVALAQRLGIATPRAALLDATEDLLPSIPSTLEAAEIARWAATALPGAIVDGPMALDLVLSHAAAEAKGYVSKVSGEADILVVPEITTGNALFKLMVLGMGACAGGLVLGARVPLLLTSRSQQAPDRIASVALGAIVADRKSP